MKAPFFEKLLEKVEHLGPDEVQGYLLRLAKEKGFLETVFNTLQEGVVVLDKKGKIEYFNRAAERLLSLPDALNASIQKYLKDLDWPALLKEGHAVTRMLEIHYPEHRWLEFYLVPLEEDVSFRGNFVVIFHDVTQAQQATQEAIESEKLQAITLLAASVAHELGNPLNSLNIHLQLMERDLKKVPSGVKKKLKESIAVAQNEIKRLDSIISQFLQAIRPTHPELKPNQIGKIVEETLELLKMELKDRNILVEREFSAVVPDIMIDEEQLKQAFYNIVRNAIQAMGKDGILRVTIEQKEDWAIASFVDNGSGISAEDLPHILQPYYTTKKEGHGLGLMIVQRIVQEHGGELELESEKGRGTTVKVKLPLQTKRVHLLEAPKGG